MRILLINPNRYLSPPVPPIGLEHVAGELERAGHEVSLVDLCFEDDPVAVLSSALSAYAPAMAGITVRNIDTVLYPSNEFFLDDIRECVQTIKSVSNVPVIIGGAGVSADPEGVCGYLGADHAVVGPAEDIIGDLAERIHRGDKVPIINRRKYRYDMSCRRLREGVDYGRYLSGGGIAGFSTHAGCTSTCPYCIEAATPVSFRPPEEVIGEIRTFVKEGITRFHLCDPEFNEDNDYCMDFCEGLRRADLGLDWAVYMKPAHFSKRLMGLMARTGVSLITLTVDSWKKCPLYWDDIQKMVFAAHGHGVRVVVDFLCGFPREDDDVLPFYLDLFKRTQPDRVSINTYIRLYKGLRLSRMFESDPSLASTLIGQGDSHGIVRPVFYNRIPLERLREAIGGDGLFRIEGFEKGVNYQR